MAFSRDATLLSRIAHKSALVTNADTSLLSFELVRKLSLLNCTVTATCSSEEGCSSLKASLDEMIHVALIDFSDLRSVLQFTKNFSLRGLSADYIVLNPARDFPSGARTIQGYEMSFGVTYLSNYVLVQSMLPLLTTENADGIISFSSVDTHFKTTYLFVNSGSNRTSRVITVGDEGFAFSNISEDISSDIRGDVTENSGNFLGRYIGIKTIMVSFLSPSFFSQTLCQSWPIIF
jgi:NAD(P)-dependent dehydrogenase (short-subunit alcohol dehydrogenase family)